MSGHRTPCCCYADYSVGEGVVGDEDCRPEADWEGDDGATLGM